jgi:hypothetical protein
MSNANPYGTDLGSFPNPAANGAIDLDAGMIEVTGRTLLAQSLVRRQTTPTGSVSDSPNDCVDVRGWLSNGVTTNELHALAGNLKTELLKDERVVDVSLMVSYNAASQTLTIVENFTSGYGPFTLTLTVTNVTISILVANQGSQQ